MVIRTSFGKQVISQHLFGVHELNIDSEWMSTTGFIVKIYKIEDSNLIYYCDISDSSKKYVNDSVNFQLHYSKIL